MAIIGDYMHCHEACIKSKDGRAIRNDNKFGHKRLMIVNFDGEALISIDGKQLRKAFPHEYFGYNDWEPY